MRMRARVVSVVGTRPEAIKMAPVVMALREEPWAESVLLATGQHRDLLDQSLAAFGLEPDVDLDLMRPGQTLSQLTGRCFQALEPTLSDLKPDIVLAQGDTTTVMAVATACFYLDIPFGHVEAGLRTYDMRYPFPEEFNRRVVGLTARLHFAPTKTSADALRKENVAEDRIFHTGNTVIDALHYTRKRSVPLPVAIPPDAELVLMTAHRRESFGAPLRSVFESLRRLCDRRENLHILYPVHPNPNVTSLAAEILGGSSRIHLVEPLDYSVFVSAMNRAKVIVTDSGGVQEEAPALAKPVLVIRAETERPEAVAAGVVKLIGLDGELLERELETLLSNPAAYAKMAKGISPYGDGNSASRITGILKTFLGH